MRSLKRVRVLASLTSSGIRDRWAQDEPAQQLLAVLAFDLERLAELLLDQVRLVKGLVAGGDGRQGAALAGAEPAVVLAQRPHPVAEGGGLVLAPGGTQLGSQPAAQLIEPVPGPLDHVEGVIPTSG